MRLERIYDETLAQASYLVGCEQTAVAIIVDPGRDIERYVDAARQAKMKITFVTETHIHADFVSGSRELANATGASLLLSGEGGADWSYRFVDSDGAQVIRNGDRIEVGTVRVDVLHTPGHTPEHLSFLITDTAASDRPVGLLTGDFLFVGDVGRPDLLERAANVHGTMDLLARRLFRSIQSMSGLPDFLQIWPGHGAGSACGKSLGALPSTTLGYERIANWAFQVADEDEFVREVTSGQPEPPKYFARMKAVNRDGPSAAPREPLGELSLDAVRSALTAHRPVIDVRSTADFAAGHIPGALNLPVGTSFATWAGSLLPYDQPILILADDPDRIDRARRALLSIGFDDIAGFAGRAVRDAWVREVGALETIERIDITTLANGGTRQLLDVRRTNEWNEGHIPGAEHRYLGDLLELTKDIPRDTPLALHCQGGTRSAIAASLLQANGFTDVVNAAGGFDAWERAGLPISR